LSGVVFEGHVVERDVALDGIDLADAPGVFVLGPLGEDFLGAVETGERLGQLGTDGDHLQHGRDQERQVTDKGEPAAEGERGRGGQNLAGADIHHGAAHHAHQHGGRKGHQRDGSERAHDVVQQALHAGGENPGFAGFGMIALDYSHAGQRLGETAGDVGGDFAALAEDRADLAEGLAEAEREYHDEEQRDAGQQRADAEQDDEREQRRQDAAHEIHQAGADQVAHALHVAHDAGDQGAGFVGIVVDHGQTADVLLHLAAQLGDEPLALFGKQLGEGERGDALNDGGGENSAHDPFEVVDLMLIDDVVHQKLGSARQDQAAQPADEHQQKADRELPSARAHQFLEEGQRAAQVTGRFLFGFGWRQE